MTKIKTFFAAAALMLLAVGSHAALGGVSISTTQYHEGASPSIVLKAGESATYSVAGTWLGYVHFQRSLDGTNFVTIVSSGALGGGSAGGNSGGTLSGTVYEDAPSAIYRWYSSSWTSGGFVFTLADGDDQVREFINHKGKQAFVIKDDSVSVPGNLAVAGNSAVTGNEVVTGNLTTSAAFRPLIRTKAQFDAMTPAVGDVYLCSDCTIPYSVCVGTGAVLSGFKVSHSATVGCGTNN